MRWRDRTGVFHRDQARLFCNLTRSYIEGWYNPARRHSGIGYLSPIAYETQMLNEPETT